MKIRRNTIIEVADRAGVSPTTVSHVLSGNRPVSPATQKRVRQVIDEIGYRPSSLARGLRLQTSGTIALIVPDIANPYYPAFARGVDDAMAGMYLTFVCSTDASREREQQFARELRDRQVDGMVIAAFSLLPDDLEEVLASGMPVISLGDSLRHDPRVDLVNTDGERGAFEATQHLIDRGHMRIGVIGGDEGADEPRMAGFQRALSTAGRPFDPALSAYGGWVRQGGAGAMRNLLGADDVPTAVFALNDLMAIGAMDAIREHGLSVPSDVAVVGYDDIEAATLISPSLTTVLNPAREAGFQAGRLLVDRMTGRYSGERREVTLEARLVIRQSS